MEKKKILIVDDEAQMRSLLRSFFKERDYIAIAVESGLLGLSILSKERFDGLISDINMPHMDGVEFVRKAKALNPDMAIILLTGYASLDTAQEAVRIGINDYLTKPVDLERLKKALDNGITISQEREKDAEYYGQLVDAVKREKALLDSMKDEFVTLVSHELKTPVTAISLGLDILGETVKMPSGEKLKNFTDEQKRSVFERIDAGRRRLLNTIENITYYTNLSRGNVNLNMTEVALNTLLENNFEGLKPLVFKHGDVLKKDFTTEKLVARIDREKILDVLSRLVHNAACHNTKGTSITLRLHPVKGVEENISHGEFASIEISDNGQGIEKSVLENIFTPFNITDMEHHDKGLGLGLSICKKVIDSHSGRIKVESKKGKGTKVTIYLHIVSK